MDWVGSEFLLPLDVEEFRLEKNVKPEKQSQDEIEKLSVQEGLSETERVYLLVDSTYDVQKIWAIEQLPTLLQNSGTRQLQTALQTFLPKLKTMLQASTCSADVHAAASASLSSVVNDGLVTPQVFVTNFLPIAIEHFDSKNPAISSKWEETLLASIPILPPEVLKHQVMLLARARGQLSQSISARQSCCRIIGKMAGRLEPYWVKQELLPLVRSLSQDVDHEVRSIMCQQLPAIATGLGLELCNTEMLPEVEKLLSDEMGGVRCSALTALTDLIPMVDKGTCQERVIPLAVKSIQAAAAPNEGGRVRVQRVKAAELIGRLCHQLKAFLTAEQSKTLLELYYQLASTPPDTNSSMLTPPTVHKGATLNQMVQASPQAQSIGLGKTVFTGSASPVIEDDQAAECRRLCAYNLPAMILFADSQASTLMPVLKSLASDPRWKVRQVIAAGIHELIPLLIKSQNTSKTITKEYIGLLKDKHPEVLMALITNLGQSLQIFASASNLDLKTRQPGLLEFIQPLLNVEQLASKCRQWRLHSTLLEEFSCLTVCMTSDQLYNKFVPVCWKYVGKSCVLPVKEAACTTLCGYIRVVRKAEQRKEICARLVEECAQHSNYRQRLLFIDCCKLILSAFSRQFFKEHFFKATLELANDPMVNVRLRLCDLFPSLKVIILLPPDRELQQMFEAAIATLLTDRDSECQLAMQKSVKQMGSINYRIQSMVVQSFLEEDREDHEKEMEEQLMLKEEEAEKDHSAGEGRKAAPVIKIGGSSPNPVRAALGKKSPVGKSSAAKSPSLARKGNGLGGACSAPNSPRLSPNSTISAGKKHSTSELARNSTSVHTSSSASNIHDETGSSLAATDKAAITRTMSGPSSSVTKKSSGGSTPNLISSSQSSTSSAQRATASGKGKDYTTKRTSSPTHPQPTGKKAGGGSGGYGAVYTSKASKKS